MPSKVSLRSLKNALKNALKCPIMPFSYQDGIQTLPFLIHANLVDFKRFLKIQENLRKLKKIFKNQTKANQIKRKQTKIMLDFLNMVK